MTAKFSVGDKVRFNLSGDPKNRVPLHVRRYHRPRTRTIVGCLYDARLRRTMYELGLTGRGRIGYLFKSHQLIKVSDKELHTMGRPW